MMWISRSFNDDQSIINQLGFIRNGIQHTTGVPPALVVPESGASVIVMAVTGVGALESAADVIVTDADVDVEPLWFGSSLVYCPE